MSVFRRQVFTKVLSAATGTTFSTPINVTGYEFILVQLTTAALSDGTLKFIGSIAQDIPSAAAPSNTNPGDYLAYQESLATSETAGGTALTIGASESKLFRISTKGLSYVWLNLIGNTAGSVTAWVRASE